MNAPQGTPTADLSSLKIDDRARKASSRGQWLGWLAVGLIVLLAGGAAIYHFRDPKPVVEVTTARSAANASETALLNASGYVTPRRRSSVAAKITGRVIEVDTDEGMHIKEGQIIARLDCSESNAALASAKADRIATQGAMDDLQVNLANAERELQRIQKLNDAGVSTPQALDTAQTLTQSYRARISLTKQQVTASDRRIDVAQENVNNCTIRAPFSGQVVSKDAQVGEMVSPISAGGGFTRTGIATIVDMESLEIEVDVNESYISRVMPHQRVSATLDAYPNWQIPSHVRTIIPTENRQKATVKVRITFDKLDPRILPDMGVKVAFLGEEQPRAAARTPQAAPKALIPTIGSFAVALFLFGLLVIVRGAFSQGVDIAGADRLVIINKTSLIQPLPLSYRDRLLRIAGVKQVTFQNWFGGVYQDEKNFFPQFALDVENQRALYPEFKIPEEQWKAFVEDREGAVAGQSLADRFGWKVGDRIPIKGTIYAGPWEFNLRGIYRGSRAQDDTTQFWFHWDFLEERRAFGKGDVGWYVVRVTNPDLSVQVAKAIDTEFANSPFETKTDTEKAFAASFVKQMGNIEFLILTVGSVVFFTLLLVTGNTMAIAVRERIGELAVLKALGFSNRFVLLLVMVESLCIAFVGGGLGLLLAKLFSLRGDPTHGILPYFYLSPAAMVSGVGTALLVGVAGGILPALSAMHMRVVDAIRRV